MRRCKRRCINHCAKIALFKPCGVASCNIEEVNLLPDELESLRLRYVLNLQQIHASKMMNVSQSTFHRILASANKKVSDALVNGKALRITQI